MCKKLFKGTFVQQPHTELYKINIIIHHVARKLMTKAPRSLSKHLSTVFTRDGNTDNVSEHEPTDNCLFNQINSSH